MAKGSGLSLDSDRIGFFLHPPIVINSFPEENNHHHHHDHHHHYLNHHYRHHPPKLKLEPMEATPNTSTVPTIQFPVNLNCTTHDQDSSPSDDKRTVIDEMDFFADEKQDDSKTPGADKKDHLFVPPPELDFNVNTGLHLLTANTGSDQSMVDDGISPISEDKKAKTELTALQAELERINAENQRLRDMLDQVTANYNALQMHLMTLMQQRQPHDHKSDDTDAEPGPGHQTASAIDGMKAEDNHHHSKKHGGLMVPRQFMDLGLAAAPADTDEHSRESSSEGRSPDGSRSPPANNAEDDQRREESPENGSNQGWGPNKVPRLNPSKNVDQAAATEATMRKARVSVRARSEAPLITDGCQWRKYGQKMAKGNPCPRAYYRCTMAAGCPVRKQVQRCAEDRTILITTYEGNHNHPLPPAAMAMASTTSSAARMLLSGSMSSADGLMNSNFLARTLLPCSSSMATISASAPFPTVTLDLTQTPNPLHFQRPPNQFNLSPQPLPAAAAAANSILPQIFGQALYNQSKFSGLQLSQEIEAAHQGPPPQQNSLADTVTALTADPNFTAALAAAITSLIGGGHPGKVGINNGNAAAAATTTTSNNNGSMSTSNNSNDNNKVKN